MLDGITAATVQWTAVNAAASARHFGKRHVVFYTNVFLLPLSATHRAIMGYMELGSCYL